MFKRNCIAALTVACIGSIATSAVSAESCPRVEGFYSTWDYPAGGELDVSDLATEQLTHIIVAFAYPHSDGTMDTTEADRYIDDIVEHAHANNTGVMLSVGGAGVDFLSMDAQARSNLVDNLVAYAELHQLDGIDVDWEDWSTYNQPNPIESAYLLNLVKELREKLPQHLEVSVDVQAGGWSGINFHKDLDEYADIIRFMAYDYTGGWGGSPKNHHAAWEYIHGGLVHPAPWSQSMITKYEVAKTSLGIPFYNKSFPVVSGPVKTLTAREIVDVIVKGEGIDYNQGFYELDNYVHFWETPELLKTKTDFVSENGYPGIFIWELHQDSRDEDYKLLDVIAKELPKCQPCAQQWQPYPSVYSAGDVVSFEGKNWKVNGGPLHGVAPQTLGHAHRYTDLGACKTYVLNN
ncbi:glycoside hydrolase family 18 protein [Pseudoalteromonas luteoviolacea]|uniref:chitinase n=1 Tax=Pseudoalteromonas luteoviolacea (strain 2ta16) TaxID=1353533 RepID=V4H0V7_PSEL2|nr:glycoside hydrolase family 18 protein [Pseudoalteromonas luteoviolacea]ESP91076.1 Chitinase [Pseudoalteromonas luteoviolacea 2ta16]KZN37223.1 chitin-binding protein [Pseudoalteromonas luteoviolacea NCIMB 1944]